jgi:hypothetical protein
MTLLKEIPVYSRLQNRLHPLLQAQNFHCATGPAQCAVLYGYERNLCPARQALQNNINGMLSRDIFRDINTHMTEKKSLCIKSLADSFTILYSSFSVLIRGVYSQSKPPIVLKPYK